MSEHESTNDRSNEPDQWNQILSRTRKHCAAKRSPSSGERHSKAKLLGEPMRHDNDCGTTYEPAAQSHAETLYEQELPVLRTFRD